MPKSKVRKKTAYTPPTNSGSVSRTPVKVAGPTHPIYIGVMLGVMLLGLIWLIVQYLAIEYVPFLQQLGSWNFAIGFGLIVVGLLMTMRWR